MREQTQLPCSIDCPNCGAAVNPPHLAGSGQVRDSVGRVFACPRVAERARAAAEGRAHGEIEGEFPLPKRFAGARLGVVPAGFPELAKAHAQGAAWLAGRRGMNLICWGGVGTGKSHLLAALVHAARGAGQQALFVDTATLLAKIRATFDGGSEAVGIGGAAIMEGLQRTPLLMIDDLDKIKPSAWATEVIWQLVSARYNAALPTAVSLNSSLKDLARDSSWAAIADRLRDQATVVILAGATMRRSAA